VSDVRILEARWYVLRNDLIGGWAVATCEAEALSECPARLGCCVVADLFTESVAHYIADLHNATIGESHTTTLEAEIASLRSRVAELTALRDRCFEIMEADEANRLALDAVLDWAQNRGYLDADYADEDYPRGDRLWVAMLVALRALAAPAQEGAS